MNGRLIWGELREHAPYTALGTLTGIVLMALIIVWQVPRQVSIALFWICHPAHVLLSALVTAAMYRRHSTGNWWRTLVIGYIGSVGIATVSDSLIPFVGEWLLQLPYRHAHVGFIEKWWLVNPLALAGIAWGYFRPHTHFTHAGHVLLSTWASLFHITMALGTEVNAATMVLIAVFLFIAVWIPCCTSDIVFPLLWVKSNEGGHR